MNLIVFLIRLPWFAYLAIAGGVVYLGTMTADSSAERAANVQAAIDAGPPPAVALHDYERPDQKFAEATVRAQIVTTETTRLVDRTNGIKTGEDIMVALADPNDGEGTRAFHGIMILSVKEFEAFADWAMEHVVDFGALGPVIEFSGAVSHSNSEKSHAEDALADRGNSMTSGVLFFQPYIVEDRDAYLARQLTRAEQSQGNFNGIAAFIALFGFGKLLVGRRIRSIRESKAQQGLAAQAQEDAFNAQNQAGLRNF